MPTVDDVVAVLCLDQRDRWKRDALSMRECDPLPPRPHVLRGRPEAVIEVRARLDRTDDRIQRDDPQASRSRGRR